MALFSFYFSIIFYTHSTSLEELSVRSNIALSQKKFLRELDCDSEELEAEYVALCAQVVSEKRRSIECSLAYSKSLKRFSRCKMCLTFDFFCRIKLLCDFTREW